MTFILTLIVWFAMAAVLVAGILMAIGGKLWLLVLAALGFVFLFSKYGCLEGQ